MDLDLNLTYLKFFHDAALSGSVSESAKRNFVTQSAVSQGISKLERALGNPLCQHKKQHFKLTEEGLLVFEHAKNVFSSVRKLHNALDRSQEQARMPVNFVSTQSVALSLLPEFLPSFANEFPQVAFNFLLGGLSQIRGWLKQGIAEFALVLDGPEFSGFKTRPIRSGVFTLFRNEEEEKSPDSCGIYVENRDGFLVQEFQGQYAEAYGGALPIRAQLNSWELTARCMQAGGGYGLFPDLLLRGSRYSDLMIVGEAVPRLPYQVCAVNLRGEELSYSANRFLDRFVQHLR